MSPLLCIFATMKTNKLTILAAVVIFAACTPNPKPITIIDGEIPSGLDEVWVTSVDSQLDTVVAAEGGVFHFETPTDVTTLLSFVAGDCAIQVIPDGTPLKLVLSDSSYVNSDNPRKSVMERYTAYLDETCRMQEEFLEQAREIYDDSDLDEMVKEEQINSLAEEKMGQMKKYSLEVLNREKANIVGLVALLNAAEALEDEELEQALGVLAAPMKNSPDVAVLSKGLNARNQTTPGDTMKDFSWENVKGFTPSGDPVTEYTSLSSYVGLGKYTLVDFWASWCQPCKAQVPYLKAAAESYPEALDVVSIAVWDEPSASIDTAKVHNMDWTLLTNAGKEATDAYGFDSIPTIILFNPDGVILEKGLYGPEILEALSRHIGD